MCRLLGCVVALLLSACASTGDPSRIFWPLPSVVAGDGPVIVPNRAGRTIYRFEGRLIKSLVAVHRDLERVSGVRAQIIFTNIEEIVGSTAAAGYHDGKPAVFISPSKVSWLDTDRDALAVLIGHELAHIRLGHASFVGLLQAFAFSREQELAAEELGLRWAVVAGYDPCGLVRVTAGASPFRASGKGTHSLYAEFTALANKHALKANGRLCN